MTKPQPSPESDECRVSSGPSPLTLLPSDGRGEVLQPSRERDECRVSGGATVSRRGGMRLESKSAGARTSASLRTRRSCLARDSIWTSLETLAFGPRGSAQMINWASLAECSLINLRTIAQTGSSAEATPKRIWTRPV